MNLELCLLFLKKINSDEKVKCGNPRKASLSPAVFPEMSLAGGFRQFISPLSDAFASPFFALRVAAADWPGRKVSLKGAADVSSWGKPSSSFTGAFWQLAAIKSWCEIHCHPDLDFISNITEKDSAPLNDELWCLITQIKWHKYEWALMVVLGVFFPSPGNH